MEDFECDRSIQEFMILLAEHPAYSVEGVILQLITDIIELVIVNLLA